MRKTRRNLWQKVITHIVLLVFVWQSTVPVLADPVTHATTNGVPVIEIERPDVKGLSHNRFGEFNVKEQGLIFNNSPIRFNTTLGGYIMGNKNLSEGTARLILAEVVGNRPTNLGGYMEIAGQKAGLIIANPNGISGAGFGFINVRDVTLTTGRPIYDAAGDLRLNINSGKIELGGNAIDLREMEKVDILAQAVEINSEIWAKEINVVTGNNQIKDGVITEIAADTAPRPEFALDISAVGGMYAGKIKLIGTEKGLGVNNQGLIQSTGDIIITNQGKIINRNMIGATEAVRIESEESVHNEKLIIGGQDMQIKTSNLINNRKIESSRAIIIETDKTINNTGQIAGKQDLRLNSQGQIINRGILVSEKNLQIKTQDLVSSGQIESSGNIEINAIGDIENSGKITAQEDIFIKSPFGEISNQGTISSDRLEIGAKAVDNVGSMAANKITVASQTDIKNNGIIEGAESIDLQADALLHNTNKITGGGKIKIKSRQTTNEGIIHVDGNLALEAVDLENKTGTIEAQELNINGQTLQNRENSKISALGQHLSAINITKTLNNQGQIAGAGELTLKVGQTLNNSGTISGKMKLAIESNHIVNESVLQSETLAEIKSNDLHNQNGGIIDGGTVKIKTTYLGNAKTAAIKSSGSKLEITGQTIDNYGQITANGNIKINAKNLSSHGQISAGRNLQIESDTVTNQGTLYAGNHAAINAKSLYNNQGSIEAGSINITADTVTNNNQSQIIATKGDMDIKAKYEMTNSGKIESRGNLAIKAEERIDNQGQISAQKDLNLEAETIANSGDITSGGKLDIAAQNNIINTGKISAQDHIEISAQAIGNQGEIAGNNQLTLSTNRMENTGKISALNTINIQAKKLNNNGEIIGQEKITIKAKNSIANAGKISAQRDIRISTDAIVNQGELIGGKNIGITAGDEAANTGRIIAQNNLKIKAKNITSSGTLQAGIRQDGQEISQGSIKLNAKETIKADGNMAAGQSINITAHAIDLESSEIKAHKNIKIQSQTTTATDKAIINGAKKVTITTDTLNNSNGQIAAGDLKIHAANLDNTQGQLISQNNTLELKIKETLTNTEGKIAGEGTVAATATDIINNQGKISAEQNLAITAQRVANTENGQITSRKNSQIQATDRLNNQGDIKAEENIQIDSGNIISGGNIEAGKGNITLLAAQDIDIAGKTIAAQHTDINGQTIKNSGSINSQTIKLTAKETIANQGKILAAATGDLKSKNIKNQGIIQSGFTDDKSLGQINLSAEQTAELGGKILASGNIEISGNRVTETGTAAAYGNIKITGNTLENQSAAKISAGKTIELNGKDITNHGQINSGENTKIAATHSVTNTKTIVAAENLSIEATIIKNQNGSLSGLQGLKLQAKQTIDNSQGQIEGSDLTVSAATINNQAGTIRSQNSSTDKITATGTVQNNNGTISLTGTQAEITAGAIENNQGTIDQSGQGNLTIQTNNNIANRNGTIKSNGDLNLQAATIDNAQGSISAKQQTKIKNQTLDNQAGQILSEAALEIKSNQINNTTGNITSQNTIQLDIAQTLTNNQGQIRGQEIISKNPNATIDNTAGTLAATKTINIVTGKLENNQGKIQALENITIETPILATGGIISADQNLNIKTQSDYTQARGSSFTANGSLEFITTGNISNEGTLSAAKNLRLEGKNINNQAGATITATETVELTGHHTINNQGHIDSANVAITGGDLTNHATILGDKIAMNTNNVENKGTNALIAATEAIEIEAANQVTNSKDGNLFSLGNIAIKAGNIENISSNIEAWGNIRLDGGTITNKREIFETEEITQQGEMKTEFVSRENALFWGNVRGTNTITKEYQTQITETKVKAETKSAQILAGADIDITGGTLTNEISEIKAGANLSVKAGQINNISAEIIKKTVETGTYITVGEFTTEEGGGSGGHDTVPHRIESSQPYYDEKTEILPGYQAILEGGQNVTLDAQTINNTTTNPGSTALGTSELYKSALGQKIIGQNTVGQTLESQGRNSQDQAQANNSETNFIKNQAAEAFALANGKTFNWNTIALNGLFKYSTVAGSKYLIQSDERFTKGRYFTSSGYLLDKLGINPGGAIFIGDGLYEQNLIRQQLETLAGRASLQGNTNSDQQYKKLLESGAKESQKLNLTIGQALSDQQKQALTEDIVWLEEKEIQGQKVLVPVVYIAQTKDIRLTNTGSVISGKNVEITARDTVTNRGTISGEQTAISAKTVTNREGIIEGIDKLLITAKEDILNQSGKIQGKDITIETGRNIVNEELTQKITTQGQIERSVVGQQAQISGTGDISLKAGADIKLKSGKIEGQNIALAAGNNIEITSQEVKENGYSTKRTTNLTSDLTAQGDLSLMAGQNINITSGSLKAEQDLQIKAGGNIELTGRTENIQHDAKRQADIAQSGKYVNTDQTINQTSSLEGKNITLESGGNITAKGAQITAKETIDLTAGGNISLEAVNDRIKTEAKTGGRKTRTDDEYTIGTTLQAGGDITVKANGQTGNITLTGSNIISDQGKISLEATQDITIQTAAETHEYESHSKTKSSGLFSSKTTETYDYEKINQAVGSTISGDSVAIKAGENIAIKGSDILATKDIAMEAGQNITIESAADTGKSIHEREETTSGIFGGGGLGFTIGKKSETEKTEEKILANKGSIVGSLEGSISIKAGEKVNIDGSHLSADKNIDIQGKTVDIKNALDLYDLEHSYEFKQSGLSVSFGNKLLDNTVGIGKNLQTMQEKQDGRLQALYAYDIGKNIENISDALKEAGGNPFKSPVSISISVGSSKAEFEEKIHAETAKQAGIQAGGNISIKATEGDINIQGSTVTGKDVSLEAKENINIEAAKNSQSVEASQESSGWSLGYTIGGGISGSYGKGEGKEEGSQTSHSQSEIKAEGNLNIKTGQDLNIIGSKVEGEKVKAEIGGNLKIESLQETNDYDSKESSVGIGIGKDLSVSGGINKGKTDSDYKSATDQAGIYAGKEGFDIYVEGNTHLKGGVIASEATPDKNKLDTGTLTYEDIENKAKYESDSKGIGFDTKSGTKNNPLGVTPAVGVTAEGEADSTTKSAIANGEIEIRNNPGQDISDLSRDPENALNKLGEIFDKTKVEEQRELADKFGKVAFNLVHTIGDELHLKEGSLEKSILHAAVGGIIAELGGGKFQSGAIGAGLNEILIKEIAKIKDPGLQQALSYLIGKAAAEIIGEAGATGGATAVSGTKNNLQYEREMAASTAKSKETADAINEAIPGTEEVEAPKEASEQNTEGENEKEEPRGTPETPEIVNQPNPDQVAKEREKEAREFTLNYLAGYQKAIEERNGRLNEIPGEQRNYFDEQAVVKEYDENSYAFKLGHMLEITEEVGDAFRLANGYGGIYKTLGNKGNAGNGTAVNSGKGVEGSSKAGGEWSQATFQSEKLLNRHLDDHLHEFGGITQAQYVQKARDLLNSKVGGDIEGFTNNLGWTFRYNKASNEFAIGSPQGSISTMMKPELGREYWLEQVGKYRNL